MHLQHRYTHQIKAEAARLGFDACNIAKAQRLDDEARMLDSWLTKGFHGGMQYMENHFELRVDPGRLVPGAKSVIVLLLNYFPQQEQNPAPKISKYAYGHDYHEVIKNKLKQLLQFMQERIGEVNGRGFVDSAPVLERSWAMRSGLGWIGKNGNLITKQQGSFFFIATLITDLELEYDDPFAKDCGCSFSSTTQVGMLEGSSGTSFQFQTINGARYRNWFAGIGIGYDRYRLRSVPLFLDLRWSLFSRPNTPFVYGDVGYNFDWPEDRDKEN